MWVCFDGKSGKQRQNAIASIKFDLPLKVREKLLTAAVGS